MTKFSIRPPIPTPIPALCLRLKFESCALRSICPFRIILCHDDLEIPARQKELNYRALHMHLLLRDAVRSRFPKAVICGILKSPKEVGCDGCGGIHISVKGLSHGHKLFGLDLSFQI